MRGAIAAEKVEYSMRAKKDTNAPKRPRSAFIFFSNVERASACLQSPKELSQRWHALNEVTRSMFRQMADNDKKRFQREKAEYKQTRAKKDPNAVKRPASAFILFSNVERTNVFLENPNFCLVDITRELSRRWAMASPDVRAKYNDIAKAGIERFLGKPRRNVSAYKWFLSEERPKVCWEHPELRADEINKKVARRWVQANPQTKARFNLMAGNDKQRYVKEMASFRNEPKRNVSAYKWFFSEERPKVCGEHPGLRVDEINKEVSRRWTQAIHLSMGSTISSNSTTNYDILL